MTPRLQLVCTSLHLVILQLRLDLTEQNFLLKSQCSMCSELLELVLYFPIFGQLTASTMPACEGYWVVECCMTVETYKQTDQEYLKAENNQHRDAGSTASTAVLVGDRLLVANVGDSRAVISRGGTGNLPLSLLHVFQSVATVLISILVVCNVKIGIYLVVL